MFHLTPGVQMIDDDNEHIYEPLWLCFLELFCSIGLYAIFCILFSCVPFHSKYTSCEGLFKMPIVSNPFKMLRQNGVANRLYLYRSLFHKTKLQVP